MKKLDRLDFIEYDQSRVSKVCVNLQTQQISNTKAQKSYVSAVFPQKTPSPTEVEFNGTSHLDEQAKSTYSVSADSFSVC